MPKLVTSVPKYRKHRATGQALVTINGRDHYLGPHGTKASHLEYDRLINQWIASNRSSVFGLSPELSEEPKLSDLMNAYRKWAEKYYRHPDGRPTGTAENIGPIMKRLRLWYGTKYVSEFTPLAFKDVIKRLIDEKLSISTVNDAISRIKHLFRWGVSEELVSEFVLRKLETVSSEHQGRSDAKAKRIVEAVSADVVAATIPKMPEIVKDMVRLQRLTGMRPSEVCHLRPCDVTKTADVWLYSPYQHKTQHHGKTRVIVIAGKAQAILQCYMNGDPDSFCFSPKRSVEIQIAMKTAARVTPLSCGNKPKRNRKLNGGPCYTTDSYRRAIQRACESVFGKGGIKWAPNQLRHSLAEEVQEIGGIEATAAVLGHSKLDTSKIYAKHNLKLAINTMKQIG